MTQLVLNADEKKILSWVDDQGDDLVSKVKAWSKINSGSYNTPGLEAMQSCVFNAFERLGGETNRVALPPSVSVDRDGNLREVEYVSAVKVSVRSQAPIRIVLTGHFDTVFPQDCGFDNWKLIDDDTINGPGVADMKGGLLVMLCALEALERSPWAGQIGYDVLISPDEEIGSLGSGPLLVDLGRRAHIGMTYEPALADGSLAGARKGSGNFSLICRGKSAHAGREHHLGRNAIIAAADFATRLDDLNHQREHVTFNVSRIDGGSAPNVVPDLGICRFNIRVKNEDDAKWARDAIETILKSTQNRDGISAELHGGFTRPPKPMSAENLQMFEWTKTAGSALGIAIGWADTGGVCEGNNLWSSGCPNVDTLGVRGANIHSDGEIAKLSSFCERAQLSALMLMAFAQGKFDATQARFAPKS